MSNFSRPFQTMFFVFLFLILSSTSQWTRCPSTTFVQHINAFKEGALTNNIIIFSVWSLDYEAWICYKNVELTL